MKTAKDPPEAEHSLSAAPTASGCSNSVTLQNSDEGGQASLGSFHCRTFAPASSMCPQRGDDGDSVSDDSSGFEGMFFASQPNLLGIQETPATNPHRQSQKPVFVDAAEMKARVREALYKPTYNVQDLYKEDGIWQCIARSPIFEQLTLVIIAVNALWIAIDTDNNGADVLLQAHPLFQAMENFFCAFFSFEWTVRLFAFRKKRYALKDGWFVFDSMLVSMMVLETWMMSIMMLFMNTSGGGAMGNASVLRIARLLRLSRMARMARLLRVMPELMIMIKGMLAAIRSVFFTLLLLVIIMYVFGIAFTQLLAGTRVGDSHYSSVPHAMYTLLLYGTLLDDIGTLTKEMGRESMVVTAIFICFVLLAALTVMNMLIGVLCEVVSAVAATENEEMLVSWVKSKIERVVQEIDTDGDNMISKKEFIKILENTGACRALQDVGVDVVGLVDFADVIFEEDDLVGGEKELTFTEFMDIVLQLRGCNTATVKDVVDLRKQVQKGLFQLNQTQLQTLTSLSEAFEHLGRHSARKEAKRYSRISRTSLQTTSSRLSQRRSNSKERMPQVSQKESIPESEGQVPVIPQHSDSKHLDFLSQIPHQDFQWEPLNDQYGLDRKKLCRTIQATNGSSDDVFDESDNDLSSKELEAFYDLKPSPQHKKNANSNSNQKGVAEDFVVKDMTCAILHSSHAPSDRNGTISHHYEKVIDKASLLEFDADDVFNQLTRLDEALNKLVHIRQKLGVCAWPANVRKVGSSSL